jgi:predicted AAA+ superfamily ATPase
VIKVITGVRRSGKSTILEQYIHCLKNEYLVNEEQIQTYNFNDMMFDKTSYESLYTMIVNKADKKAINYIFLDEVQEIENFEKAIIALFENKSIKFDIYITGSNSKMFSSSLATLFTGRNQEIKIYPLSFAEIYTYLKGVLKIDDRYILFQFYLKYGGLPIIIDVIKNEKLIRERLSSVLHDTVNKDVKERYTLRNFSEFIRICSYAFDNIGSVFSTTNISNYINSNNKTKITHKTVERYLL